MEIKLKDNQWIAVIFPEGTRSKNGQPTKFYTGGLMKFFEHIPNAKVVALSITNSWRLGKDTYFAIPLGTKVRFKVKGVFQLKEYKPDILFNKVEQLIAQE